MIITFLTIIVSFILLFYKTIKLYKYTSDCFTNIVENETIQLRYKMKIDGQDVKNVRKTIFNVLYVFVVIPDEVRKTDHMNYIISHLQLIEESLQVQNLYGLVSSSREQFVSEENDKERTIYLVKFKPIIYGLDLWRILVFILMIIVAIYNKEIAESLWLMF